MVIKHNNMCLDYFFLFSVYRFEMTQSVLPTSTVSSTHPGMSGFNSNQVGGKKKRIGKPRRKLGRPSKKELKRRTAAKTARRKGKTARKSSGKKAKTAKRGFFY